MKNIFFILFILSTHVFAQSARPKTQAAIRTPKLTPVQKAQSLVLNALGSLNIQMKDKGGQDGGGGRIEELELHKSMNDIILRMRAYLPVIESRQIFSPQDVIVLKDLFFESALISQKVCVVVSQKQEDIACRPEQKKIFFNLEKWKSLSDIEREIVALQSILESIGYSDPEIRKDKFDQLASIVLF